MLAGHPTHVFLAVLLLIQLMNDANCQPGKSDHPDVNKNDCSNRFVYTRDQLTHLSTAAFDFQMPSDIPPEMRKRHRKRGVEFEQDIVDEGQEYQCLQWSVAM